MKQHFSLFAKVFWHRFQQNKLTMTAGFLTYSTMLAIVPLIMVVFAIFAAFPMFNEVTADLKLFIYDNFAPNASELVQQYLDTFVSNSKQMSSVGIIGLIMVALLLIHSIDNSLNDLWHNTKSRPIFISFAVYWMILTLGPLLAGTSIAVSSYLMSLELFNGESGLSSGRILLKFVPFGLTWLMFSLIYLVVPNTKVKLSHAALGALFAALFFTLGKQIFIWYVVTFPSYQAIYGALATLPIMIVWIHASWLAVLLGGLFAAVLKDLAMIQRGELRLETIGILSTGVEK